MRKLTIDLGIEEFEIAPGRILRFNPADMNLHNRFISAGTKLKEVEDNLVARAEAEEKEMNGENLLHFMAEADKEMKAILNEVFGHGNDFEEIFSGVNLMAVACNNERVITNFVAAILPILEEGAKKTAREAAKQNAEQVKTNRRQRRAKA